MRFPTSLRLLGPLGVYAVIACLVYARSASVPLDAGENPSPVHLVRPAAAPLSATALLGQQIFHDARLSSSGKISCASCHDAGHNYGPAGSTPAAFGGPDLHSQGKRAVPSLMYLERQLNFAVGPDPSGDSDNKLTVAQTITAAADATRATKTAQSTAQSAANLVPQGGIFWDGRTNTLQGQASGPLMSPFEMDGGDIATIAAKLKAAPYASLFTQLFGPTVMQQPRLLVAEATSAVARYQFEDANFHPYSSKYDYWLEGRARLSAAELRGYKLFNDVTKGDCAACHLDQPTADGLPPRFTDTQYEALGAPRNPALAANNDANYYDMGICGPYRDDMKTQTQFCGMFLTPTLRNVARRQVFFHNGVYHTLKQVMDFYNYRDVQPAKIYPRDASGQVAKYDDLPAQYAANIDVIDPPFDRKLGDAPAMTDAEEQDIIAFLGTLNDGYAPAKAR